MIKVVNPCVCQVGYSKPQHKRAFVKIEFDNDRLSVSGVVGPRRSGSCTGSCGQCVDEIRNGIPVGEWDAQMLQKLCDIWERWHLNDLRPYCRHQKILGWDKLATKRVTLYHFMLTNEALREQKKVERAALTALKAGAPFMPTPEQTRLATLRFSITSSEESLGESIREYYEPKKPLYSGDIGSMETKTLGRLRQEEHPDGILGKSCPVCGYRYGSAWKQEDVPQDVIDWLFGLPESSVNPAWV